MGLWVIVLAVCVCFGVLVYLALTSWGSRRNYRHHDAEMARINREHDEKMRAIHDRYRAP